MNPSSTTEERVRREFLPDPDRWADPLWPGVLFGIGLAGTLDEVVLHQLLAWHHFYSQSTYSVGLVSDGIFHAVSTALLLFGGYLLLRARPMIPRRAWAAILLGAGGFNLYDGIVQHKLLGWHQVREGVSNNFPYDAAFIGIAVVVLAAGILLLRASATSRAHRGRAGDHAVAGRALGVAALTPSGGDGLAARGASRRGPLTEGGEAGRGAR